MKRILWGNVRYIDSYNSEVREYLNATPRTKVYEFNVWDIHVYVTYLYVSSVTI